MQKYLSLSQIGLYNPQRLNDKLIEQLFIVRHKVFNFLIDKIQEEKKGSIPQHHLIIATRGMGKSTLLKRIEVELRKPENYKEYIPLLFPEEQYNLTNLAELWLNSLDALADTLQIEGKKDMAQAIDAKIKDFIIIKDAEKLSKLAYGYFMQMTEAIEKRPVLLVDNLNIIFDRLEKSEQHILRAFLMQTGAPILIGASAVDIEETHNYGAPFYDAFQIQYLEKLSFLELTEVLETLARLTNAKEILPSIQEEIGRLKTIHQLTGGNPRTAVMLFKLIVNGFSKEFNDDLEALLDELTPLYKARFEELSVQMQKIVDVIALNWEPITLDGLRNSTRLDNGQLSPQIKRLLEVGWIDKLDAYQAKGNAYQISERFFNIWFLMRRSSRRQKKELLCLSKFLESFYGESINMIAHRRLTMHPLDTNHIAYDLAIAEVLKDDLLKRLLLDKSYHKLRAMGMHNPEILSLFEIPDEQPISSTNKKETALLSALGLNQDNVFIWYSLGDLYQEAHQYRDAENAYLKAVSLAEQNIGIENDAKRKAVIWAKLGFLYHLSLNEYEKAEDSYLKSIGLNDGEVYIWIHLAYLYQFFLHNYEKSEIAYLKAIAIDGTNVVALGALGYLYQRDLNRYDDAKNAYLSAIGLNEEYAFPWFGMGTLYENVFRQYGEAEKAFLQAIAIDPKDATTWNQLGFLYLQHLKNYEQAEISYKRSIKLDKSNINSWNNLGALYQNFLNDYIGAEYAYLKSLSLDDKAVGIWESLAHLYQYQLHRYEKAEAAYQKIIALDEKNLSAWGNLGILYLHSLNKYDKAEKALLKVIAEPTEAGNTLILKSISYLYTEFLDRYDEAERFYLRTIEIDKSDFEVWNGIGNLYQDYMHKYDKAEVAYKHAIALDNTNFYAIINLVFLYRDKLEKLKEAKTLFDDLDMDVSSDTYWLNKSIFALYERNEGIATEYVKEALKLIYQGFSADTLVDWWRFAAVVFKLGFNDWLIKNLKEGGFDKILAPYFIALEALGLNQVDDFLNSKAVEIREPAKIILEKIKKFV